MLDLTKNVIVFISKKVRRQAGLAGMAGTQASALLSHGLYANVPHGLGGLLECQPPWQQEEGRGEGQTAELPL